jgi:hypothetical protein
MYDIEREEISGLTTRGTHAFITFGYCIMRFDLQVISNFLGAPDANIGDRSERSASRINGFEVMRKCGDGPKDRDTNFDFVARDKLLDTTTADTSANVQLGIGVNSAESR